MGTTITVARYYKYSYQSYASKTFSGKGLIIFKTIDDRATFKLDSTEINSFITNFPYPFNSSAYVKDVYNGTIEATIIYFN